MAESPSCLGPQLTGYVEATTIHTELDRSVYERHDRHSEMREWALIQGAAPPSGIIFPPTGNLENSGRVCVSVNKSLCFCTLHDFGDNAGFSVCLCALKCSFNNKQTNKKTSISSDSSEIWENTCGRWAGSNGSSSPRGQTLAATPGAVCLLALDAQLSCFFFTPLF